MFKGRPEAIYPVANFLTDAIELRSISMTVSLALGIPFSISSLTLVPEATFLTAITTCTPRKARTRVASAPIPFDDPEIIPKKI